MTNFLITCHSTEIFLKPKSLWHEWFLLCTLLITNVQILLTSRWESYISFLIKTSLSVSPRLKTVSTLYSSEIFIWWPASFHLKILSIFPKKMGNSFKKRKGNKKRNSKRKLIDFKHVFLSRHYACCLVSIILFI